MTSGLHKYDHVSHYRFVIGWLPVSSVIPHHSLVAMYMQYWCNHCLLLNLQIKFRQHNSFTPEPQIDLQPSFDTTYLLARSFVDQWQQTGGIIYQ